LESCRSIRRSTTSWSSSKQSAAAVNEDKENEDEEDEPPPKDKIERVCETLGLPVDALLPVKPLLRAYRGIRNCVAHRSGIATSAVADLVASSEVAAALAAWPAPRRDGAPALALPTVTFAEVVRVEPRDEARDGIAIASPLGSEHARTAASTACALGGLFFARRPLIG